MGYYEIWVVESCKKCGLPGLIKYRLVGGSESFLPVYILFYFCLCDRFFLNLQLQCTIFSLMS